MWLIASLITAVLLFTATSVSSPSDRLATASQNTGLHNGLQYGKLAFNFTSGTANHIFEGASREDIYAQVVAKFPDYKIPYEDPAVIQKEYDDMIAAQASNNTTALTRSDAAKRSTIEARTFYQGPNYHLWTYPIPDHNWPPAHRYAAYYSLRKFRDDQNRFFIYGRTCVVWSCGDQRTGWTVCNPGTYPVDQVVNSFYSQMGTILVDWPGNAWWEPDGQWYTGGRIDSEYWGVFMMVHGDEPWC